MLSIVKLLSAQIMDFIQHLFTNIVVPGIGRNDFHGGLVWLVPFSCASSCSGGIWLESTAVSTVLPSAPGLEGERTPFFLKYDIADSFVVPGGKRYILPSGPKSLTYSISCTVHHRSPPSTEQFTRPLSNALRTSCMVPDVASDSNFLFSALFSAASSKPRY